MKKDKIINDFLIKLELFYRNFGSDWCVNDFTKSEKNKEIIQNYLIELEKKGVIKILENQNFRIINLPSNYKDL